MDIIWFAFEKYGLVGLVIGILFYMAWRREAWIMAFVKEQRDGQNAERKCWLEALGNVNKSIDEHSSRAREFHTQVSEAHRYAREEHEKMIANLKEQGQVLARINGYKDSH